MNFDWIIDLVYYATVVYWFIGVVSFKLYVTRNIDVPEEFVPVRGFLSGFLNGLVAIFVLGFYFVFLVLFWFGIFAVGFSVSMRIPEETMIFVIPYGLTYVTLLLAAWRRGWMGRDTGNYKPDWLSPDAWMNVVLDKTKPDRLMWIWCVTAWPALVLVSYLLPL